MSHKVGYGFHPNGEEIILYLERKELGFHLEVNHVIAEVDILKYKPSQLPEFSVTTSNGKEWYFYYQPEYKDGKKKRSTRTGCKQKRSTRTGRQQKRTAKYGYWKVTGKGQKVCRSDTGEEIGFKKILTYHEGRGPNEKKTNWVIHEYHLPDQGAYVICHLKKKADDKDDNSSPNEGESRLVSPSVDTVVHVPVEDSAANAESSHQVPFAYRNISENTADESESSFQVPFDYGNIPKNTSTEDNPQLLPNLQSLINHGWLDGDSPFALQPQMVKEPVNQWLSDSAVDSSTNMPNQINSIQREETPILKSQHQSIDQYLDDTESADFTDPSWEPNFQEFTDNFYNSTNLYDNEGFDWDDEDLQNLDNRMED